MGSPLFGDVDDAFAIAAILRSGLPVAALASVFGNTSAARATGNVRRLAETAGWRGPVLAGARRRGERGSEAAAFLAAHPGMTVLALGPLTDVAAALPSAAPERIVLVGGNLSSRGRWPPWWPHEFNLTHDRAATAAVFASSAPLTVVPLDVASAFRFDGRDLGAIQGALGDFLRRGARRWLIRTRLLKWRRSFPIWDLLAAMWLIAPGAIATRKEKVTVHPNAWLEFGAGTREVTVVTGFDRGRLWRELLDRMA